MSSKLAPARHQRHHRTRAPRETRATRATRARDARPFSLQVRVWLWRLRYFIAALCLAAFANSFLNAMADELGGNHHEAVVAVRPISAGATITAADVAVRELPTTIPAFTQVSQVIGETAATTIAPGFPVAPELIVSARLWDQAPAGSAVVAVELTDQPITELLQQGDRIELFDPSQGGPAIASNALILALLPPQATDGGLFGTTNTSANFTAILALPAPSANVVASAQIGVFRAGITTTHP